MHDDEPVIDLPDDAVHEVTEEQPEPPAPTPPLPPNTVDNGDGTFTTTVAGEPQPEAPLPGIFVTRGEQPDGTIAPQITLNGDVKVTEVVTILGIALNRFKADNGLT